MEKQEEKSLNIHNDSLKPFVYKGSSMNPTLKAPDMLEVIPYNGRKICRGDVIVFYPPGEKHYVTHRVVSINHNEIRTSGDNNNRLDAWILHQDNIIGQVVSAQRGNRQLRIYGGRIGLLFPMAIKIKRMIKPAILSILRPVYRWLARTGIFRHLPFPKIKTQILTFNRPGGKELLLVSGQRVIGRLFPSSNQWEIQRPFRLFVDEASLPAR